MPPKFHRPLIVLILTLLCISNAFSDATTSTEWAERLYSSALASPWLFYYDTTTLRGLHDAEEAFYGVLSKYGRTSRSLVGLAHTQLSLADFRQAETSLAEAAALSPQDHEIERELKAAHIVSAVASASRRFIPKAESILQLERYPTDKDSDLWIVLSARVEWPVEEDGSPSRWPDIYDSHIQVLQGQPDSLRVIWRSDTLARGGCLADYFNDEHFWLRDVTGDGILEIVVSEIRIGGSVLPSHLDIFSWKQDQPSHLIGVSSPETPLTLKDLNGDGRLEVIAECAIGNDLCHAEQPRWIDIYELRQSAYRLSDEHFPGCYSALRKEIEQQVKRHPSDTELRRYLRKLHKIQER